MTRSSGALHIADMHSTMLRLIRGGLCLLVAALLWLPSLSLWFRADRREVAEALLARQLARWEHPERAELQRLRASNPEWDLMARTFSALAFANLALGEPADRSRHLVALDRIIDEALADERRGSSHFLLAYARRAPMRDLASSSLFVEGEIALMLAARQVVDPDPARAVSLRERITRIVAQLERGPVLSGESYPDEAWTFCNTVALAAIRLFDVVSGEDHRALFERWIATARAHLVDPRTGLLVSSYTWDGTPLDGPEGSTLWLAAHMLRLIDEDFARDQYDRARAELGEGLLGFAWAREWPSSWRGPVDVDSGPTIPILEANAGSSGLALVGARSFGDDDYLEGLLTSLEIGGFPIDEQDQRRYGAGNALADAVLLYALVEGPLWQRAGVGVEVAR
ncbi:MAG: hypothetical protein WBV82_09525 [Myxococcaceae bacterium]